MYSDSDVEAYNDYDSNMSSDEPTAAELLEEQIQARDAVLTTAFQSYAFVFDSEDGFFRTTFPSMVADSKAQKNYWDSEASPDCYHAVAALLNAAPGEAVSVMGSDASATEQAEVDGEEPEKAMAPASTEATAAVGLQPDGVYILSEAEGKPSPASRFLCSNFAACILVPVDKSLNRADLRAAHKEVFAGVASVGPDGLDIVPGYKYADPSGWALPITTDPSVLSVLKERYPGWRAPTAADVVLFTKPGSGKGRGGSSTAPQKPSRKSWTRNAATLMASKERFLNCVREAGGWDEVIFVALDVEAFTVTTNSVPLPAEYAFVPVLPPSHKKSKATKATPKANGKENGKQTSSEAVRANGQASSEPKQNKTVHFFCHPGYVCEEEEVTILYNCMNTHLIPYRAATFLSHDYRTRARQVDFRFVRNRRVVLINKGSAASPTLMDLQAIRWLYGAAVWQQHRFADVVTLPQEAEEVSQWIPDAEAIRCFDVSVLEAAAADCSTVVDAEAEKEERQKGVVNGGGDKAVTQPQTATKKREAECCWYHAKVATSDLAAEGVHCALRDAEMLAQRVHDALNQWRPRFPE